MSMSGALGHAGWTAESKESYRTKMSGPNNPAWRGGVTQKRARGNYVGHRWVKCPAEFRPMARKDGYIAEHRLVMAMALDRMLTRTEVVHHMNHDPFDNRLLNLALFNCNADHKRFEWAGEPRPVVLGLSLLLTMASCGASPSPPAPL
jgi:hypothetical protein